MERSYCPLGEGEKGGFDLQVSGQGIDSLASTADTNSSSSSHFLRSFSPASLQKKNDVFYCRYDDLIMIESRNGQRWPNNNDDKRAGTMT